jgi:transcriptional regulator with XRE-family HTH domain
LKVQSEREVRQHLAAALRAGRRRLGWTQQTLGEACDLPRTYVADLEGARRNPSLRNLVRIANALGVSVASLFSPGAKPGAKTSR